MDSDLDGILVTEEFINGCKEDSTILDGLSLFDGFKINTRTDKRKVGGDAGNGDSIGESREDDYHSSYPPGSSQGGSDRKNFDEEGHQEGHQDVKTKIGF